MRREAALTHTIHSLAQDHLLRHYRDGRLQEDLCFGLWYPSRGRDRLTAILADLILPNPGDVHLHGNASFEGRYTTRAIMEAKKRDAGLALLHSHPSPGWQDLSVPDIAAERELAYPAQVTGKPLLGMTTGDDGHWSARLWEKADGGVVGTWCRKVRIPTPVQYAIQWKPSVLRVLENRELQRRTIATWGIGTQRHIQNLRIGIVGLGSVGALVAESLARVGISEMTLIDPDVIEPHNLDRLLHASRANVGELKVDRARAEAQRNATARETDIRAIPKGVEHENAYREALDCDLILSCVDRPVARDVLNYIAVSHLIPVIDGGVAVDLDRAGDFQSARWRSHLVVPGNACIRCTGQYTSSDVVQELDGSLDDPSYIAGLPLELRPKSQNVFPFSLGSASMQVNFMLRYLLAKAWWPAHSRQEYRYVTAQTYASLADCHANCSFRDRIAQGDGCAPSYLRPSSDAGGRVLPDWLIRACRRFRTLVARGRTSSGDEGARSERISD